jgi:glycosyltransferase involved in cell wall biosynthesis
MRILHIMASRTQGGAEIYSADVIQALHEQGIDQCVVMPRDAARFAQLRAAGLRLAPDCLDFSLPLWQRFKIRRLAAKEKPDIIHCWMRRAANLAPAFAGPVIGWVPSYQDPKKFPRLTHFVGLTQDAVTALGQKGVAAEAIALIPTFPNLKDAPALSRKTLNTPEDAPLLLALSRLHPVKGIDVLLNALAELPGCFLWLAGGGPEGARLKKLAADLKISERVRFLGWRDDRAALLKAADICVLPSNSESFGTVALEAWSLGTPFVATAAAGPASLITHGINGMLSPVGDAKALAQNIQALLDQPELRKKIIQGGRDACQKNFTRDAVTQKWLQLYEKLSAK